MEGGRNAIARTHIFQMSPKQYQRHDILSSAAPTIQFGHVYSRSDGRRFVVDVRRKMLHDVQLKER